MRLYALLEAGDPKRSTCICVRRMRSGRSRIVLGMSPTGRDGYALRRFELDQVQTSLN
jgi:hypothetical protein